MEKNTYNSQPDGPSSLHSLPPTSGVEDGYVERPCDGTNEASSLGNWPKGWRPYLALLGSFLLMFNSWGIVNSYGSFLSYYQEELFPTRDIMLGNLIGSTQCCMILLLSFVTGRLLDADYGRYLIVTGTALLAIAMFMLSVCNGDGGMGQGNFGLTWLVQGFIAGLGMSCFFVTSSHVVATWFPKRRGTVIGIVASGAAVAGFFYPMMLRFLTGPHGFNNAVRYIATLICGTCIVSITFAIPNPDRKIRKLASGDLFKVGTWFDKDALTDPAFWWFTASVAILFLGFYPIFFNLEEWAAINNVGTRRTSEPGQGGLRTYWLLGIMNASSTIGRLGSSYLSDHFGAVRVHTVVTTTCAILCLFMWHWATSVGKAVAFVVLFGAFSGSVIGLPPASVADLLGTGKDERLAQRIGMMYTCAAIPALIGPLIVGHLITRFNDYLTVQLWSGLCLCISAAFMAIASVVARRRMKASGSSTPSLSIELKPSTTASTASRSQERGIENSTRADGEGEIC